RVMEITNATAILDSLTLTNGEAYNGGGILVDGGSTLIASNCIFSGNSAFDRYYPFGPGIGGAICGSPLTTVTLVGCTLSGNEANSFGGAVYDFPLATVTLTGCTLSGNKANSSGGAIFVDFPPATVTLTGCTLSGNAANSAGGAIDNNGTLTLNDCVLSDNVARQQFGYRYGPPGNGGGIYNHGALTLNNCILSDNSATSYLGFGAGGGICSVGLPATLNNCTLSGNTASAGGGIEASGTLTLNNCTLFDNTAGNGGGIASSIFFGSTNVLTLNNCTLSGNSATNFGVPFIQGFGSFGGYGGGIDTYGPASLNNCTLSGNSSGTNGGGIYADDAALNNCTISGNHSYYGGGIGGHVLGITNTIVAGNTPGNIAIFGQFSGANNLIGGDPRLMPLGNHGGPTQTMPPLPGSPAIDAGADSVTNFLATDQRGYPRLSGAHVDIGAVEVQFVPAPANSPPVITGAFWAYAGESNAFQFTFTNVLDADFTALASTNMALPLADWTVLGNIPEISPGEYQFTDWNATNSAQCFYRVVSP
ncbi:MAG: hypothetical protein KGR98_06530, partial [Verrucomicrobia bacterium]|nr:hypothetical protein [Verrucomicrobiota bacterium]